MPLAEPHGPFWTADEKEPHPDADNWSKWDSGLDGFPLRTEEQRLFPSSPVVSSINHSAFLGVVVPFSLRELFQ